MAETIRLVLYIINMVLVVGAIVTVVRSRKTPASVIAWIMALVVLPVVGLIAYIFVGIDRKALRLVRQIPEDVFTEHLSSILDRQEALVEPMLHSEDAVIRRMGRNMRLLSRAAAAPVTVGNSIRSYYCGEDKFGQLLKDLGSARESIHMEYYIWRSDSLGRRLLSILMEKAGDGVEVRLIFDGWGSFGRISYAYRRQMREAGIRYAFFLDLSNPVARLKINYRNHRKIAVIDGRIAYTGGMNVGTEYITGGRRFPAWRDTHLRIEGPSVSLLQAVFLVDWHNSGKELLLRDEDFPDFENERTDGLPIQIAVSGPDSQWEGIRLHYLELVNGAREEILIQSPYFIPGEALEQALIAAALRGVRVVLMTVGKPDKFIPFWAGQTYFEPLLEAGVEIFRYQAGFLHAKVLVQDRAIASVGTCNVDLRSFSLDYEVNAVVYSTEYAGEQADRFTEDLNRCSRVELNHLKEMSQPAKLRNSVVRLFSPLM